MTFTTSTGDTFRHSRYCTLDLNLKTTARFRLDLVQIRHVPKHAERHVPKRLFHRISPRMELHVRRVV